jgi:4-alpha-glucanotransferase
LRSLGIAGFKIPQWEFLHGQMTPGNEFERLSVTTYATHDHKPIRELWAEALDEKAPTREQAREDLLKIAQFAGIAPREGLEYERFLSGDDERAVQRQRVDCDCDDHRSARAERPLQCSRHGRDDELDAAFAKNDFAIAREPECSAKNEVDSQATGAKRTNVMTKQPGCHPERKRGTSPTLFDAAS